MFIVFSIRIPYQKCIRIYNIRNIFKNSIVNWYTDPKTFKVVFIILMFTHSQGCSKEILHWLCQRTIQIPLSYSVVFPFAKFVLIYFLCMFLIMRRIEHKYSSQRFILTKPPRLITMWSGLFLVFLFVVQTKSLSVLTDDRPQTSGPDGETANTDILRQLLNQETIIRMGLDKKVHDLVKDVVEMKRNVDNMKKIIVTTNRDLLDAKNEIAAIKKENSILKTECEVQSNVTSYLYGMVFFLV